MIYPEDYKVLCFRNAMEKSALRPMVQEWMRLHNPPPRNGKLGRIQVTWPVVGRRLVDNLATRVEAERVAVQKDALIQAVLAYLAPDSEHDGLPQELKERVRVRTDIIFDVTPFYDPRVQAALAAALDRDRTDTLPEWLRECLKHHPDALSLIDAQLSTGTDLYSGSREHDPVCPFVTGQVLWDAARKWAAEEYGNREYAVPEPTEFSA